LAFLALAAVASLAHAAPFTLELTGGSVINGDLVSWNGQQVVVKAEFGSLTFKREQLSQATLQRLDLLSGDPQKLVARIAELEATVDSLRKDNAALRQQLQALNQQLLVLKQRLEAATRSQSTAAAVREAPTSANSFTSTSAQTGLSYTISSTGKRHNSRCRYYGSGRPAGPNEGIPCKICGG
jgi:cell division protein FtsB